MNTPKSTPLDRSILGNSAEPPINTSGTQDKPELPYNISELIEYTISPVDKPKKKNKFIGKPINEYDRFNALIRIREVQRELKAIEKETDKEKNIDLYSRFYCKYKVDAGLLKHPEVFNKYKHSFNLNTIHVFMNYEKSDLNSISEYRDGRHIIIAVDITKKDAEIKKDFEQTLKRIRKDCKIPKDNTREKETVQDIWKVYDFFEKDKLNFVQIARKISGKGGNPTYNKGLEAYVKQVRRAYKKAVDIMQRIKEKNE